MNNDNRLKINHYDIFFVKINNFLKIKSDTLSNVIFNKHEQFETIVALIKMINSKNLLFRYNKR